MTQTTQGSTLVQGNMIGLIVFDFLLPIVRARVMDMAFVVHVPISKTIPKITLAIPPPSPQIWLAQP